MKKVGFHVSVALVTTKTKCLCLFHKSRLGEGIRDVKVEMIRFLKAKY